MHISNLSEDSTIAKLRWNLSSMDNLKYLVCKKLRRDYVIKDISSAKDIYVRN